MPTVQNGNIETISFVMFSFATGTRQFLGVDQYMFDYNNKQ